MRAAMSLNPFQERHQAMKGNISISLTQNIWKNLFSDAIKGNYSEDFERFQRKL